MPDNPNDSYDLVLQTSPLAPLYEHKERLWALAGLESTSTIPLTVTDPLPKDVLRYLRIQRLDMADLATMTLQLANGSGGPVSDENETQILHFLVESLGDILGGFAVPLEKLEAGLANGTYPAGSNAWAAAQVSGGEQRILRLAQNKAERLLSDVGKESIDPAAAEEQCANCAKATGQLKSCGRCKAVKYCGRECQVSHFTVHKRACRSLVAAKVQQFVN